MYLFGHLAEPVVSDLRYCSNFDLDSGVFHPYSALTTLIKIVQSLLCDPNPNSPANAEAARLFQENKREVGGGMKRNVVNASD